MADPECYQLTRAELAQYMKQHYERLIKGACEWHSGIFKAIDAWERESELEAEIERLKARVKKLEAVVKAARVLNDLRTYSSDPELNDAIYDLGGALAALEGDEQDG